MSLCESYQYSPHCFQVPDFVINPSLQSLYESPYSCTKVIGNQFHSKNYEKVSDQLPYEDVNKVIINTVNMQLTREYCKIYFAMLVCFGLYPKCLPYNRDNTTITKTQTLCRRNCEYLHNDLCFGELKDTSLLLEYGRVYQDPKLAKILKKTLEGICSNAKSKIDEDDEADCFYEEIDREKEDDECDGSGYDYKGTVDVTKNGNICNIWMSMCLNHSYINFKSLSSRDRNYCRNPGGYRERPWCYVNNSTTEWDFCDIPKCPRDGNYSNWSKWTSCSVMCGSGRVARNRTCTSPAPKYGGKDCKRFGNSTEEEMCFINCDEKGFEKWKMVTAVVCISLIVCISIAAVIYVNITRKPTTMQCQDEKSFADILKENYNEKEEVDQIFEVVYQNLRTFKEYICITCIMLWLDSLILEYPKEENKIFIENLIAKLESNKHVLTSSKEYGKTNIAGDDVIRNIYTDDRGEDTEFPHVHDKTNVENCFFEHKVKEWLKCEMLQYDTLKRDNIEISQQQDTFVDDGIYIDILPEYQKLKRIWVVNK